MDEQVAGNVLSWVVEDQRAIGYWIGKDFWGQDVATRALSAFLQVAMQRPLYAHIAANNLGSIKVLEECGLARTGGAE